MRNDILHNTRSTLFKMTAALGFFEEEARRLARNQEVEVNERMALGKAARTAKQAMNMVQRLQKQMETL